MISDHPESVVAVISPALLTTGITSCDRPADNAKPDVI